MHLNDGSIFDINVEALVNPVNTKGKMGKGLALEFRRRFPYAYKNYKLGYKQGRVVVGKVSVTTMHSFIMPKFIIHFPTKDHWKDPSRKEWIDDGMESLVASCRDLGIKSVAIPALGCGLGGLEWGDVNQIISQHLDDLDWLTAYVFPPQGA